MRYLRFIWEGVVGEGGRFRLITISSLNLFQNRIKRRDSGNGYFSERNNRAVYMWLIDR